MSNDRGRDSGEQIRTVAQMLDAVDRYNAALREKRVAVQLSGKEIYVLRFALGCYKGSDKQTADRLEERLFQAGKKLLRRASRPSPDKKGGEK